jgi:hypothetical protein
MFNLMKEILYEQKSAVFMAKFVIYWSNEIFRCTYIFELKCGTDLFSF